MNRGKFREAFLQGEEKEAADLFRQLLRQSFRAGLLEAMKEEVEALCGPRCRPDPRSPCHRAGSETGVVCRLVSVRRVAVTVTSSSPSESWACTAGAIAAAAKARATARLRWVRWWIREVIGSPQVWCGRSRHCLPRSVAGRGFKRPSQRNAKLSHVRKKNKHDGFSAMQDVADKRQANHFLDKSVGCAANKSRQGVQPSFDLVR